jgi:aminoglycoside phosphotransferase (APT) family kinase protein
MLADLRYQYAGLSFTLPRGVIHGDASVGNVLHDFRGEAVIIDLDGFAIGPREWDVALTAIYYDSFGWHTREEYETFVRVYGYDIMQWPGYPTMRAVREFLMVTRVTAVRARLWATLGVVGEVRVRAGAGHAAWIESAHMDRAHVTLYYSNSC